MQVKSSKGSKWKAARKTAGVKGLEGQSERSVRTRLNINGATVATWVNALREYKKKKAGEKFSKSFAKSFVKRTKKKKPGPLKKKGKAPLCSTFPGRRPEIMTAPGWRRTRYSFNSLRFLNASRRLSLSRTLAPKTSPGGSQTISPGPARESGKDYGNNSVRRRFPRVALKPGDQYYYINKVGKEDSKKIKK